MSDDVVEDKRSVCRVVEQVGVAREIEVVNVLPGCVENAGELYEYFRDTIVYTTY